MQKVLVFENLMIHLVFSSMDAIVLTELGMLLPLTELSVHAQ